MKRIIIFGTVFLIFIIFIIGCAQEKAASKTSMEIEKQIQTSPQSITKTEIKVSGQGMEMVISPSQDKVVKDIVTITVTRAPSNTGIIGFAIQGPGIEALEKTGPNLGLDSDGSDGWSFEFDTNGYPNNEYTLSVIAFPSTPGGGLPPLGAAQAQVEIKNSELSAVQSPAITTPYKIIQVTPGSCPNPLQSIKDAKRLNANTIFLWVFAGFMDNNGAAVWEPPEKAAKGCAKLIALAHENSIATVFGVGLANKEEMVVEDFHFNRQKFVQTYKEMNKAYASFAQQNKVAIFLIASEIDTLASIPTLQPEEKGSLTEELSKELIKGVKEVYSGKIAIGLAGVEPDEPEAPYYPFEGASIICFSANERKEERIEESLQWIRMSAAMMKKIGEKAGGIQEVMLCEVSLYPQDVEVSFYTMGTNAALKALGEKQSSFYKSSFQEHEKEFYHRLISEVGSELSGVIINLGPPNPGSLRGRLAENTVAEEFEKWK